jgi:hypothetical protein
VLAKEGGKAISDAPNISAALSHGLMAPELNRHAETLRRSTKYTAVL